MSAPQGFSRVGIWVIGWLVSVAVWAAPEIAWQGHRPVPTPVQWAASAVVGERGYLMGGAVEDDQAVLCVTGAVQIYDPASEAWASGAPIPEPRCLASAAAVGGKIYVMGGRTDLSGPPSARNDVYDPGSNTWSAAAALPHPLAGHAAASFNGKIYVMGGVSTAFQSAVQIYDPASDSWSAGNAMPQALAYGALAASGGKLVWMGGALRPPAAPEDCFGFALLYDPIADIWSSSAPALAAPVLSYGQCAVDPSTGKVYLAGGETVSESTMAPACAMVVQCYDPSAGAIAQVASMPAPVARARCAMLSLAGKVFVFGGVGDFAAGETFGLVDSFDPSSGAWQRALPDLPDGGGGTAGFAAVLGRTLVHVRGGASGVPDGKVDIFDLDAKTWRTRSSAMPTPVFFYAGGTWNGKVVVSGGLTGRYVVQGKTYLYDPEADAWSTIAADSKKRFASAGAVLDGKFYVFGGDTSSSTTAAVADLHILDLSSGSWSVGKSMPFAMEGMVALACGAKIYVTGGTKGDYSVPGNLNAQLVVYDPATDSYDLSKTPMPRAAAFLAGTVWDRFLILHGGHVWRGSGSSQRETVSNAVQIYDTQADVWTLSDGLFGRTDHRAVAVDGTLFLVSGTEPGGADCERLNAGRIRGLGPSDLAAVSQGDPLVGTAPLAVRFAGSATGGRPPYYFTWSFDADGHSEDPAPAWTFQQEGDHVALLTVTDSDGERADAAPLQIHVAVLCAVDCTASVSPPTGTAPLAVSFSGTATASHCASSTSYSWSFGDGATSDQPGPSHTYAAGSYTWTFTAIADGISCSRTGTVMVSGAGVLPGDCDGDGAVSIGEVQKAVNMFLGTLAPACGADCNGDATVSIGEVQKVVNAFLGTPQGC